MILAAIFFVLGFLSACVFRWVLDEREYQAKLQAQQQREDDALYERALMGRGKSDVEKLKELFERPSIR